MAILLILAPRLSGVLAALFGLQRLLPRGWVGRVLAEAWLMVPYSALILLVAFRAIDPALPAAARGLGKAELTRLARNRFTGSFLDERTKAAYLGRLDAFVAAN